MALHDVNVTSCHTENGLFRGGFGSDMARIWEATTVSTYGLATNGSVSGATGVGFGTVLRFGLIDPRVAGQFPVIRLTRPWYEIGMISSV
jgi:hypothetical protein